MAEGLSMPLFITPKDCILRMQLSEELAGVTDVISSGIIAAQLHVQRVIDGKLQRQSFDCEYYLDGDAFSGLHPDNRFRLELPSGFIRKDTPVVVQYGSSWKTVSETLPKEDYRIDYERGYLLVDEFYEDKFLRVRCDTGFEDGTRLYPVADLSVYDAAAAYSKGDKVSYNGVAYEALVDVIAGVLPTVAASWKLATVDMEQIPMDLYEAIMGMVPVLLDWSQVSNHNQESKNQYQNAADHSFLLLTKYCRIKGFSFRASSVNVSTPV